MHFMKLNRQIQLTFNHSDQYNINMVPGSEEPLSYLATQHENIM